MQHKQSVEVLRNVKPMAQTSSSLNANFAVEPPNGFVGDQLIFVKTVILDKTKEITSQRKN